ncbi:hypothetical protein [Rhodovulum steppense]|uniref:Uncharacterized protein n=1 Tax=Rhodovulum steppense TaxID=540251 RepID=A0A4R1YCG6_9RHOB|nr:hypothetical protein [Rhodovulum steppense]TCM73670.1 hypothetical protein EV216_1471 [Rhodovulum steppense]
MRSGRRILLMGLAKAGFLVGGVTVGAVVLGDAPGPQGWRGWSGLIGAWLAAAAGFCWSEARLAAWHARGR